MEKSSGSFVLSLDAELGWGFHDHPSPPMDRLNGARDGWRTLRQLTEQYEIPATWAVVGHLLLGECDGRHPTHPLGPEWFGREHGDWHHRPDLRFGSDLVEAVLDSSVDHDIGCHTFSHVNFDDERVDRTVVEAELDAAFEVAREYGIEYDSFVFPRNAVEYRDLVAAYGFKTYRPKRPQPAKLRRRFEKLCSVADPSQLGLVTPEIDEYGMVAIPPSLFLFGFQGKLRRTLDSIWVDPIVRLVTAGIDRAIRENGLFHVWLHPNDIRTERDVNRLKTLFEYVDDCRDRGLRVETMADVAKRCAPDSDGHSVCKTKHRKLQ